jgi:glutamate-1-semialdehyde 2,1-aminomutase
MVKFAKNGSDVTTAAVKLARAFTGRDLVLACQDQPFFSTDDWFIGVTAMPAGIPQAIRDLTLGFPYNDAAALDAMLTAHAGRVACVIMEAETTVPPAPGYLAAVEALCRAHGALLILDEMVTGFRWHNRGAQFVHGLRPDLSAFGKAMGNGFPISALVGRRDVMELGGLRHERERVFLLSTTHGAEHGSLAAAMETMRIYQAEPVIEALHRLGERLRTGLRQAVDRHGLAGIVDAIGRASNLVYVTRDAEGRPSQAFRALFMQELIRGGILAPSFVVSYAHSDADIDRTIDAVDAALTVYRRALEDGPARHLEGRAVKPVFRPRN